MAVPHDYFVLPSGRALAVSSSHLSPPPHSINDEVSGVGRRRGHGKDPSAKETRRGTGMVLHGRGPICGQCRHSFFRVRIHAGSGPECGTNRP